MDVFNPKILDASIRDVSACLTDNQKADLLLYAMRSLRLDGPNRIIIENAVQSCLQISTLTPENEAKARVLRARARLAARYQHGAQEDLQAALLAEPDNPEAKALLHQRSVTVEKLLSPPKKSNGIFSPEIWREIALYLPRQDLKALLFVKHTVSRVASQLLFRKLDLHLGSGRDEKHYPDPVDSDGDNKLAQRSADILTRIIVDHDFARAVRTLRIYAHDKDGSLAFQTGMLTNAVPNLINLRNVHISATMDAIRTVLRVLHTFVPRLRGLSLQAGDETLDLGLLDFKHLTHFAYTGRCENTAQMHNFVVQNRDTLRTFYIDTMELSLPTNSLSIRNLTRLDFTGRILPNSQTIAEILTHGRQLESLSICCFLECAASSQFRTHKDALPFLRHFVFSVFGARRMTDRDLFPAVAEFLRGRQHLKTLQLSANDENVQRLVGFDASVWGVLPSLVNLKALMITYPTDLTPGLAPWLIPRSVTSLSLALDGVHAAHRDPVQFLDQLRPGIPQTLRYIGLSDSMSVRNAGTILRHGFPMVKVVRIGSSYWTVHREPDGSVKEVEPWATRTAQYHSKEWLEWLDCEEACASDPSEFLS